MNNKEKSVLFVLLENPGLLEKVSINPEIFRGQSLDIFNELNRQYRTCLLYTSPSPRDRQRSRMPSSA